MNELLEEVRGSIKAGIEDERERMNDKYNEDLNNVDEIDNIPKAIKQLVDIYGNTMEQRVKMIEILNDYLKADFFKGATNGREGKDIVRGANSVFYNNGNYYVGFSTSRLYTIEVGRNENLRKPSEEIKRIGEDIVKFVDLWDEYDSTGKNYDKVIDLYSIMKRAKPAGILYKMNPSLRTDIKNFARDKKNNIEEYEERKELWERRVEEFEEEEVLFQSILDDLKEDLDNFADAGWRVTYENVDNLM